MLRSHVTADCLGHNFGRPLASERESDGFGHGLAATLAIQGDSVQITPYLNHGSNAFDAIVV
ncbi:hypothetical protein K9B32_15880 [Rhizobium sp. 3T7]|uniref:hypothetical protein n=1 Tax=Rhizobium sp. 3T7 TaxID=2874922 RepID=UPI001CCA85F7|nr:hypothetical protein [Rhizobium sp. 3T7]MBZ9791587.1 hypothetical protein [Rhizobium sp. 3T7]